MANPIPVLVETYVAGGGAAQSGFVTFTFVMTSGFEAWIPVTMTNPGTTSISAGAEVRVFRSTDRGATWETAGSLADGTLVAVFPKPTTASQVQRKAFQLGTGWYVVQVLVGGGAATTFTAEMGTAWVISAYA